MCVKIKTKFILLLSYPYQPGVSSLRKGGDARMVAVTIGFFLALSTMSAIMGASAGHLVHPGRKITSGDIQSQSTMSGRRGVILDSMLDLLR
ncbi:amino acid transporter [Trichonephila inaurata madagascariensis]|uniref:Amino acid transporter n=1 Tax=Trichonephila inaurata madagascariensis TaxID=2747483 RepID=A0A8X6YWZ3_9ARAC|nr:amino acid transporter [Trichonephila inaurata madagascariensis]